MESFVRRGCAPCANSDSFLTNSAPHASTLVTGIRRLFTGRHGGKNILSISARAMASLATCTPNCISGGGRLVINLRASDPLGHNIGPFNNVHVTHRTYTTCNCQLDSGIRSNFGFHAARGSNIFHICASRVHTTHGYRIVANLPSTCNHNHVVNSCHQITLCNVSHLIRRGGGSGGGLTRTSFRISGTHLTRRLFRRVHFLNLVGRVTTVCNCSVDNPTSGTHRTVR